VLLKKKMNVSTFASVYFSAVKAHQQAKQDLADAINQLNEESPFMDQARKLAIETVEALKIASNRFQLALLLQCYNEKMKNEKMKK
jgi:hypothetical protein